MIVGICGLTKSGKSAAADVLVKDHGYVAVAFGDALKRILMELFNFTEEQLWGSKKEVPDERYPRPTHEFDDGEQWCKVCGMLIHDTELVGGIKRLKTCYLTPRYAMQTLGTEWGRKCYSNVWVEQTMRVVDDLLHFPFRYTPSVGLIQDGDESVESSNVVIPDVRFKSEMDGVAGAGGKLVRITRPGHEKPKWDHPSETEQLTVPDSEFDYIIHNNGTLEDLALKVEEMMMVGFEEDGLH